MLIFSIIRLAARLRLGRNQRIPRKIAAWGFQVPMEEKDSFPGNWLFESILIPKLALISSQDEVICDSDAETETNPSVCLRWVGVLRSNVGRHPENLNLHYVTFLLNKKISELEYLSRIKSESIRPESILKVWILVHLEISLISTKGGAGGILLKVRLQTSGFKPATLTSAWGVKKTSPSDPHLSLPQEPIYQQPPDTGQSPPKKK